MNILKIKSIFKLFIALTLVGVLITSCEKENLVNDSVTLTEAPLLELKQSNTNLNEISLRNCIPQGINEGYVDYLLGYLIDRLVDFDNNPNGGTSQNVQTTYGIIVNYINSVSCTAPFLSPTPNWNDNVVDQITQNDIDQSHLTGDVDACPFFTINSLLRLQGAIERYLDNPSCVRTKSLSIKLRDYIITLNNCFGDFFTNNNVLICSDFETQLEALFDAGCPQSNSPKCN